MDKKYVFIVEDNEGLRFDIERILGVAGYIVYSFESGKDFWANFKPMFPAVMILDMRMPDHLGIDIQADLLARGYSLPIIFISGESTDEQIIKAFKNGALDFLLKPFGRSDLLAAVTKAIESEKTRIQNIERKNQLLEVLKKLSPREKQVFELLAKGYGNKELMDELGLSLPTIKQYKAEVMYKLELKSLAELIALNGYLINAQA